MLSAFLVAIRFSTRRSSCELLGSPSSTAECRREAEVEIRLPRH